MENVFVLISPNAEREEVQKYLKDNDLSHLEIWTESGLPSFINPLEPIKILLLSGGTELQVKNIVRKAFSRIYIICVPINNALSAGAELNGYYFSNTEINITTYTEETFKLLFNVDGYKKEINNSKLLLIGNPHEWVLTSEYISPPAPFKTKIMPITIKELLFTQEHIEAKEAHKTAEYWLDQQDTIKLPSEEFYSAAVNYLAIKKLLLKYDAKMLSIRCGELQKKCSAQCLTMNRLNKEGIIAACEGDIEAAFSLKVIQLLTSKNRWMTNVSHIDFGDNLLYLTQCNVPVDLFSINGKYLFNNAPDFDFIEEFLDVKQPQDVTVFRMGKDSRYNVLEGTVNSDILGKHNFCRSAIQIQANSSLYEWFSSICGNHQIVVYGKYANQLKHFFQII